MTPEHRDLLDCIVWWSVTVIFAGLGLTVLWYAILGTVREWRKIQRCRRRHGEDPSRH
jgi:hypothetical protein